MKHEFICEPCTIHEEPLRFAYDEETGEITGPGASVISHYLTIGAVSWHPLPGVYELAQDGSLTDLAAIIGDKWKLPEYFGPHYPKRPEDDSIDDHEEDIDLSDIGEADIIDVEMIY